MNLKEKDKAFIANTYGRFDLLLEEGNGTEMSGEGRKFLDFASGIAVSTFGTADSVWAKAVSDQAYRLGHTSNLYYSEPCVKLAELLCKRTGLKKVFFGNSGAEANECAIKAARKYSHDRYGEGRHTIVTLRQSFHGRTMATLSATGQDVFHTDFMPFLPGFVHVEPNDIDALADALDGSVCAFMFECVQGEGGVRPLDEDYLKAAAALCREKDILMIADEVQCGNGRTGKYFAYMHYGISPDIVTTAKGLGGGLPIGACLFNKKTEEVLGAGKHGSTFGGNPICCAGAITVVERLTDAFLKEVGEKAAYLKNKLESIAGVTVSGMGLMLGLTTPYPAKDVVAAAMARGLLVITAKDKVRLLPPLNITNEEIDTAVAILADALQSFA